MAYDRFLKKRYSLQVSTRKDRLFVLLLGDCIEPNHLINLAIQRRAESGKHNFSSRRRSREIRVYLATYCTNSHQNGGIWKYLMTWENAYATMLSAWKQHAELYTQCDHNYANQCAGNAWKMHRSTRAYFWMISFVRDLILTLYVCK